MRGLPPPNRPQGAHPSSQPWVPTQEGGPRGESGREANRGAEGGRKREGGCLGRDAKSRNKNSLAQAEVQKFSHIHCTFGDGPISLSHFAPDHNVRSKASLAIWGREKNTCLLLRVVFFHTGTRQYPNPSFLLLEFFAQPDSCARITTPEIEFLLLCETIFFARNFYPEHCVFFVFRFHAFCTFDVLDFHILPRFPIFL